jgi:hypothetical protein
MSLVVPNTAEIDALQKILNTPLTLRLYSNNAIPSESSSAASFTETTGGGYANKPLVYADWAFTAGTPSYGQAAKQSWTFTGAVGGTAVIYGYYVTRNSDGVLMWAERFPPAVIPFTPKNGSLIQITPKFTGSSVY